jgi:hypothetical protein
MYGDANAREHPMTMLRERVHVAAESRPVLFVVVDTEEEFDWSAGFSSDHTRVGAIRKMGEIHTLLARYGVRPCYVVDFPVAHQPGGYEPLKEFLDAGECTIGAHLHPWVNPPFIEPVTRRNSFGCNLDAALEAEKISALKAEIGTHFGVDARIYKAGRYGFGPSTAQALEDLGFDVDMSINPHMDFSPEGGPSFNAFDASPFFFGKRRPLLEIPCSTGYVGLAGRAGSVLHRLASKPVFRPAHAVGMLSRLGIVNKTMLSPESATRGELCALTRGLLARGMRTFTLTFHSPSVEPGHTPYVRTTRDLAEFTARIESFCDFFFGELEGTPATPEEFRTTALRTQTTRMTPGHVLSEDLLS